MLTLSPSERRELEQQARAEFTRADSARHAQLILLLADGYTWAEIRARLGCSDSYIARWSKRFAAERLAGLYARHAGRERYKVTDKLEKRVLTWTTRHTPADGSRHWSSRKLAAELGGSISHMTVARIWAKHGIQPHQSDNFLAAQEPNFDATKSDIIGLYLHRPQHAAVFSVREVGTSASELSTRVPAALHHAARSPDAASNRSGAGALALHAALRGRAEELVSRPYRRNTSAEFAAFLADIAAHLPEGRAMHAVADNIAIKRTRVISMLLANHPHLHLHFTPTYTAWLDQVERHLVHIEHGVARHGIRSTAPALAQRLMRQIRQRAQRPAAVKWRFRNSLRP